MWFTSIGIGVGVLEVGVNVALALVLVLVQRLLLLQAICHVQNHTYCICNL